MSFLSDGCCILFGGNYVIISLQHNGEDRKSVNYLFETNAMNYHYVNFAKRPSNIPR